MNLKVSGVHLKKKIHLALQWACETCFYFDCCGFAPLEFRFDFSG